MVNYHFPSRTIIDNTLELEFGRGMGADGRKLVTEFRAGRWLELIRRARRPAGATKEAATGRIVSKRSTARRVTTSAWVVRVSARAEVILMSVNVSARASSRRKVAFL